MPDDKRWLAALIAATGVHSPNDTISDDQEEIPVLAIADGRLHPDRIAAFRDSSVLVAVRRQMHAVQALVALDGLARRIILWPQDERLAGIKEAKRQCGADIVITTWPPEADHKAGAPRIGPGDLEAERVSEWVLLTSGSSGEPKCVVHTLQTLAGHLVGKPAPGGGQARWCTFYDVRRYGGMQFLLRALVCGGSLALSSAEEDPEAFLRRAGRSGITHILGTPSHWRRALMTPAWSAISPVYVRLSGEVANQTILDQLRRAYPGAALVHAFAATEAGLGFEVTDGLAGFPASLLDHPPPGVELRVRDGVLQLRSARAAQGLLGRANTDIRGEDGFVDTGDSVALEGDRYSFVGRRDGIINVGGNKVHPEEVEAVINQHPWVRMSRVLARRNPIAGAIVIAEIVASEAATGETTGAIADALRSFCQTRLPPHKVPVTFKEVADLGIAASGKLVRPHA